MKRSRRMMIGKSLRSLFEVQKEFQNSITGTPLPEDNTAWFSYHMQAMVEELGEVLKADKRWKTHRNNTFDQEEKKKELADIFITIINLFLFSGIDSDEAYEDRKSVV